MSRPKTLNEEQVKVLTAMKGGAEVINGGIVLQHGGKKYMCAERDLRDLRKMGLIKRCSRRYDFKLTELGQAFDPMGLE